MTKKEINLIKQRVKKNHWIFKSRKIFWGRFNKYLDSLETDSDVWRTSDCPNQCCSYWYTTTEIENEDEEEWDRINILRLIDMLEWLEELGLEDVCIEDGVIKIRI